ncbi:hypothetical protein HAX54_025612 [Datura stramonium]|uniref:Uncharacterized protein n=1 Tax=Datura stramonium TaxID=4076 RepID=A0ABS8V1W1_DATST|nr:hypothetical protein [Datura stramonium]
MGKEEKSKEIMQEPGGGGDNFTHNETIAEEQQGEEVDNNINPSEQRDMERKQQLEETQHNSLKRRQGAEHGIGDMEPKEGGDGSK